MRRSLAIALWLVGGARMADAAEPLRAGDLFPSFSGKRLTGKSLELPAAAAGKAAVIVFGFSRVSGKDSALWTERLSKESSDVVPGYQGIVLESAPRMLRGVILSGIKNGMPAGFRSARLRYFKMRSFGGLPRPEAPDIAIIGERAKASCCAVDQSRPYAPSIQTEGFRERRSRP